MKLCAENCVQSAKAEWQFPPTAEFPFGRKYRGHFPLTQWPLLATAILTRLLYNYCNIKDYSFTSEHIWKDKLSGLSNPSFAKGPHRLSNLSIAKGPHWLTILNIAIEPHGLSNPSPCKGTIKFLKVIGLLYKALKCQSFTSSHPVMVGITVA